MSQAAGEVPEDPPSESCLPALTALRLLRMPEFQ